MEMKSAFARLSLIFNSTTASYKFFWYISLLDLNRIGDKHRYTVWDVGLEMVINSWHPVLFHSLSFGKQDSLPMAVSQISRMFSLKADINKEELRQWMHNNSGNLELRKVIDFLPKNVPYRFLRPWIDTANDSEVVRRSHEYENGCPYSIMFENDRMYIVINDSWIQFLRDNYLEQRQYAISRLASFLERRNPGIGDIEKMLTEYDTPIITDVPERKSNNNNHGYKNSEQTAFIAAEQTSSEYHVGKVLSQETTEPSPCPFCHLSDKTEVIFESQDCIAFFDAYPVSKGHTLIIPKRHVASFFDLGEHEMELMNEAIRYVKATLDMMYHPDGYNIGVNVGQAAGQSIFHCHIHVIPRYKGDMDNPKGGVRGVIPNKQQY